MTENSRTKSSGSGKISIDYDQPDVEDIMHQIRERISSENSPDAEVPDPGSAPESAPPIPGTGEPVWEPLQASGLKRFLLKLSKPFAPVIKLLILPVHRDLLETVHRLDYTNRRLDFLNRRMEEAWDHLSRELYTSVDKLNRKVDLFNDAAKQRLDSLTHDLGRTMEYTKLLHGLAHNMVVELSKLKIEEEGLKTKNRILEKDFEHLHNRERALERRVFE